MKCTCSVKAQLSEHIWQTYQADLFSFFAPDASVGEARTDPALPSYSLASQEVYGLIRPCIARYVYECLEHRRESGIASVLSSGELCAWKQLGGVYYVG